MNVKQGDISELRTPDMAEKNKATPFRAILIVANPTSGRGRGTRTAEALAANLRDNGRSTTIAYTKKSGEAEAITREALLAGTWSCIVGCGGDGTIQEIANALASNGNNNASDRPPLGLAPAGRCNDFARALGIPTDPAAICEVIEHGAATPVDLGKANGRFFCTVATMGIDAEVSRFVDGMKIPLRGRAAYVYGALRMVVCYRPKTVRLEGDFGVIEQPIFLASTANTSSYGGAIEIAPDANPTDAMLDMCVIDHASMWRTVGLVLAILRSRHRHNPHVRFLRTRQVEISSSDQLEIWADGEPIATTPATLSVQPGAIDVLLPIDRSANSRTLSAEPESGAPDAP